MIKYKALKLFLFEAFWKKKVEEPWSHYIVSVIAFCSGKFNTPFNEMK